jgi:hypothetical protein
MKLNKKVFYTFQILLYFIIYNMIQQFIPLGFHYNITFLSQDIHMKQIYLNDYKVKN